MNDKVILTDCDGVIVDWEYGFEQFMNGHGYEKVKSDSYDLREQYGCLLYTSPSPRDS